MKTKRRFLSILLVLCMVLTLVPITVFAATAEAGTTPDNPILIHSAEDLQKLDQQDQYLYAKLMVDIDLQDVTVAGKVDGWWNARIMHFRGELDGNGHTISNTTTGNAFIGYFHEGVLKNFTWNLSAWSSLVANQEHGKAHTYSNITATGNVAWTTNNGNESVFVVYPQGDTTFDSVSLNMDMTSPTYHGLFIGYEPDKDSDYVFRNCSVVGHYLLGDVGVLFGNGSYSGDFGLQHIIGANNTPVTSTVEVTNLDLTNAQIVGVNSAKLLCGVSYKAEMDILESQLAAKVSGYANIQSPVHVDGVTVNLNSLNQVEISATEDALSKIGSFEVISEVYASAYTNGVSNGSNKFSVSDRIQVQQGVTKYYSLLGKVPFFDNSSAGTKVTTGLNGELNQVEINGTKYYTITEQAGNTIYTFGRTPVASNTSRNSGVRVAVYDKAGKLNSTINITGTGVFTISQPTFATSAELNVGDTLSQHALADGWAWASPDIKIVEGGQWAFAVKDTEMVPVEFTGVPVLASSVSIGQNFELQIGQSKELTATVMPENATDKSVTWTSSNAAVATIDDAGNLIALSEGKATITAKVGAVTGTCVVTVTPTEAKVPAVDPSEPVEEVTLGVGSKDAETVKNTVEQILVDIALGNEVSGVGSETKAAIVQALEAQKDITTEVIAQLVETINAEDQAEISSILESNETIAQYLDLKVIVKADGEAIGTVDELNNEITFTVAIPEDLKVKGRTFFVIRLHHGVAERLDTTMNVDGTLSFSTDRFSTYALAYEDEIGTQPDNPPQDNPPQDNPPQDNPPQDNPPQDNPPQDNPPQTGDGSNMLVWIAAMMMAGTVLTGTALCARKGKHSR